MTSATLQQKVDIKMSRFDNAPWGFRVHGGIDFGSPLTIQKVRQSTKQVFKFVRANFGLLKIVDRFTFA